MLTNDTVEVHLQYLRSALDRMQAAVPALREKVDLLATTLDAKIEKTNSRIQAVNTLLDDRIEALRKALESRIDSRCASLDAKIERHRIAR